jgi:hypothetical protein
LGLAFSLYHYFRNKEQILSPDRRSNRHTVATFERLLDDPNLPRWSVWNGPSV